MQELTLWSTVGRDTSLAFAVWEHLQDTVLLVFGVLELHERRVAVVEGDSRLLGVSVAVAVTRRSVFQERIVKDGHGTADALRRDEIEVARLESLAVCGAHDLGRGIRTTVEGHWSCVRECQSGRQYGDEGSGGELHCDG